MVGRVSVEAETRVAPMSATLGMDDRDGGAGGEKITCWATPMMSKLSGCMLEEIDECTGLVMI